MRPKRSGCRGDKWRITLAASMRCRAPSCWHARAGKWNAMPRRKWPQGRVNWPWRKVEPEQRPTHPYVAPHTSKIHTLITLGIRHRNNPLVFKAWQRLPRGFDSHRPLHFSLPGVSLRCSRMRASLLSGSHSPDAAPTGDLFLPVTGGSCRGAKLLTNYVQDQCGELASRNRSQRSAGPRRSAPWNGSAHPGYSGGRALA